MSDFFIQNEHIRDKIGQDYFADSVSTSQNIRFRRELSKNENHEDNSEEDEGSVFSELSGSLSISSSSSDSDSDLDMFDHTPYIFLDPKDGILERDFGLCIGNKDITKHFTVYICGYRINEEGVLPFLQYHMYLENGQFTFPSFKFHCATNVQVEDDEERTPEQVFFQNECMKRVLDIVDIHSRQDTKEIGSEDDSSDQNTHLHSIDRGSIDHGSIDHMYKGFIEMDQEENAVLVMFDYTGLELRKPAPVRRVWATVDEIVYRRQILGYAVPEVLTKILHTYPELRQLYDLKGKILDTPSMMYLCTLEGGQYKNEYKEHEEEQTEQTDESTSVVDQMSKMVSGQTAEKFEFSIVDDRVNHPSLGDFFIFSTSPLNLQKPVFRIQRYVGFLFQPTYILRVLSTVTPSPPPNKYALGSVIPSLVDYMSKPAKPSTENGSIIEPSGENGPSLDTDLGQTVPEPSVTSTIQDLEQRIQDQKEFNVQELATVVNLDNTCIYFHEMVADQRTPFWCIKSRLHFTKV